MRFQVVPARQQGCYYLQVINARGDIISALEWSGPCGTPHISKPSRVPCLDFVNLTLGDWISTYNPDENTWTIQKNILSWTVHVRTQAVISDTPNYCRHFVN